MHDNEGRRVRGNVDVILQRLVEHDRDLLLLDANERTITGRLGVYLQELFPEWNVDCEYNRILECVKQVVIDGEMVASYQMSSFIGGTRMTTSLRLRLKSRTTRVATMMIGESFEPYENNWGTGSLYFSNLGQAQKIPELSPSNGCEVDC